MALTELWRRFVQRRILRLGPTDGGPVAGYQVLRHGGDQNPGK
jgi:hypothetical protein